MTSPNCTDKAIAFSLYVPLNWHEIVRGLNSQTHFKENQQMAVSGFLPRQMWAGPSDVVIRSGQGRHYYFNFLSRHV